MNRIWWGYACAVTVAGALGMALLAQGGASITLRVEGMAPGSPIEISGLLAKAASGKGAAPTASTPTLPSNLAAAAVGKTIQPDATGRALDTLTFPDADKGRRRIAVYKDDDCVDGKTRLLLIQEGIEPPPECKRRTPLGWVWVDDGGTITVDLKAGTASSSKPLLQRPVFYIAAGGAAALGGLAIAKGGGDSSTHSTTTTSILSSSSTTTSTTSISSTTTTASTPNGTAFNTTATGTLNAGTNTCNFSSVSPIRGMLAVDSAGRGTWQKTHTSAAVTFNFIVALTVASATQANFQATTQQQVGSQMFSVTDTVSITIANAIKTLIIQELFTSLTGASCMVSYSGSATGP
jgi:hypothetical protein